MERQNTKKRHPFTLGWRRWVSLGIWTIAPIFAIAQDKLPVLSRADPLEFSCAQSAPGAEPLATFAPSSSVYFAVCLNPKNEGTPLFVLQFHPDYLHLPQEIYLSHDEVPALDELAEPVTLRAYAISQTSDQLDAIDQEGSPGDAPKKLALKISPAIHQLIKSKGADGTPVRTWVAERWMTLHYRGLRNQNLRIVKKFVSQVN